MCLILFAYRHIPGIRLLALANRDEFYDRPSEAMHMWDDPPEMLGGKDLLSGGTWLGVCPDGRLAAVTNYREGLPTQTFPASRGKIPLDFLNSAESAETFIQTLKDRRTRYATFNLLLMDQTGLWHYCSADNQHQQVEAGIHGLSNQTLDTPWPKVVLGTWDLSRALDLDLGWEQLLGLMQNQEMPEDSQLPDTGVGLDWERMLSPLFIQSADYGTRSTTLVIVYEDGRIELRELIHPPDRAADDEEATQTFRLNWD